MIFQQISLETHPVEAVTVEFYVFQVDMVQPVTIILVIFQFN